MTNHQHSQPKKGCSSATTLTKTAIQVGLASALLVCTPAWSVFYAVAETQMDIGQNTTKIGTDITKKATSTAVEVNLALQRMVVNVNAGTMVENKQSQVNAEAIIQADANSRKELQTAKQAMALSNKLQEIRQDYGASTGQGHRVCTVAKDNQTMGKLSRDQRLMAENIANNLSSSAGKLKDPVEAQKQRDRVHKKHFCNESDVANGQCKEVSPYANADVNAGSLFEPAQVGSTKDIAKDMVREHIMGSAPPPIKNARNTALGQAYLNTMNQQTALKSFPNYAISYVQAYTTVRDDIKDANGNPMSPQEQSRAIVGRHYGSNEATAWTKTLVTQRPRGLLLENAKQVDTMIWQLEQMNEMADVNLGTLSSAVLALGMLEKQKVDKIYQKMHKN